MRKTMKRLGSLLLVLSLLSALAVTAFAAEPAAPTGNGVYDLTLTGAQVFTQGTEQVTAVQATINGKAETFYPAAERFQLALTGLGSGEHALIFILKTADGAQTAAVNPVPTAENLWFIDQKTASAEGTTEVFNLFPKTLEAGSYSIWKTTSTGTVEELGSFRYYVHEEPGKLGDIDENGNITATDALYAMQMAVGSGTWSENQSKLADVDKNGQVTATDALRIMQFVVGVITSFK